MFKHLPSRLRSGLFPALALMLAGAFSTASYAQSGEGVCLTCTVPGTAGTQDAANATHIVLPTYVYTYVKPGETYSFSGQVLNGGTYSPTTDYVADGWKIYAPNGQKTVNAGSTQSYTVGANEGGIWTLVIPQGSGSQWRSYGVSVANGSTPIAGRTYTLILPIHQDYSNVGNGIATFTLWYINISGGIYKSTFNNYTGWDSNVYADAAGVADASKAGYQPLRKSLPRSSGSGSAVGSPNIAIVQNGNRAARFNSYDYNSYSVNYYKQFFTQPDGTLPTSAPIWDMTNNTGSTTWLRPTVQNPDITNLKATVDGSSITYTFNVSNYNGTTATLQIDQDGNGTTDYTTTIPVTTGANTYRFNTTGTGVSLNANFKSTLLIDKSQEIHFVLDDVEGFGGLSLVRQNGGASGNTTSPTLYWDDTSPEMSAQNSNPPAQTDGTSGANSDVAGGIRGWAYNGNANSSWGNNSYIDNWAYEIVSEKESIGLLSIAGKVFNDVDGASNGINNGQGTNAGGLSVLLVDNTNVVVATTTVNANGTYSILLGQGGTFSTVLSTQSVTTGTNLGNNYASSLPTGWVNTGENLGTSTGNDGTPNGILSLGTVTANVTDANFGIEQPPVAGSGSNNGGTTPSGTTQANVPASTFTNTTPSSDPTAVTGIRITQFPAGATSIVVNGTTYTTANVAALTALVIPTDANGNPTVTITVDPTATTSTTVTIPFKAIDAAGKESANTGNAVVTFTVTQLTISGKVFNDVDGISNGINGQGTNAGGLFVSLVDNTNTVVSTTAVNADGTYSFVLSQGGTLSAVLSTQSATVGASLPTGWVNTGENLGTSTGNDGTPNGILSLGTVTANVTDANFGIEQPPVAGSGSNNGGTTPSGTTQANVPASTFTNTTPSSDPTAVTGIRITQFPAGATSIVVNGTTYTTANVAALTALVIPTDANGNPTVTITVDPTATTSTTVTIPFKAIDAAGKESANTGNAVVTFTVTQLTISGKVFNDVDGISNGINGQGTNAGGLFVSLVDNTNTVVSTTAVNADGTYSFVLSQGGTLSAVLSTQSATVGASLPTGWVNTGENLGTSTGNDGTPNGILSLGTVTANVTDANFGIEQPPVAGSGSTNGGTTPSGTTQANVPASTFTNTTNSSDPTAVTGIRITQFPAGATSIVVNGTTYTTANVAALTALVIPTDANGNPTVTITVDPTATTSTTVTIPFKAIDAAGKESANTGNAVVTFTVTQLTISGKVFNDVDGISNGINGQGTNAGGLFVSLVDNTNTVVSTTAVNADGTYSFVLSQGGTLSAVLSTQSATVGASLPTGWVNTGENLGTSTGNDGTPNGILSLGTVTANVTDANFGIEQPPVAGNGTTNGGTTPSGTTQANVPASTFTNTTPSSDPTAVTGIRITQFPTGATSIVVNGTTYTTANVAALTALVIPTDANGNPTVTITVDPTATTSTTVTISFKAIDAAGKESANTGNAVVTFTVTQLTISGKVFNDVDGISNGINGQGTNAGGLFVSLVDNTNTVVSTTAVNADGTYSFLLSQGGTLSAVLSTQSATVGASLPTGWVNTGENLGTSTGNDGTPNGILSLGTVTANVTDANFGIEQPPVAGNGTTNGGTTPSGTTQANVPASTFTNTTPSNDPTAVTGIRITQFPTGATSIVVNGTTYTTANVAALTALVIPTDANGNPTVTITVDPTATTSTTVTIPFKAIDAAGKESANTGNAVITFTVTQLTISGKVFNDVDGISNGINGQGTNAGGLFVSLVDNTNTVVSTTAVNADGTYSFVLSQGGTLSAVLSTQSATVGASLPTGWVNTGENLGTSTGNDGTPNGILSLGTVTANVTDANFGIEQPPVAGSGTTNGGAALNGTTQAPVPASTFTNTTPSSDPTAVTGIRITQFPTGATSIVISGTTYTGSNPTDVAALTALVIPTDANGNPTVPITVDPTATTSTTVTIPFKAIDAAGKESANTGNAVITFSSALPVGLINFGAKVQSDQTVLTTWSTSWEFNNQVFVVERSKDLITFEEVAQIRDVAGNQKGTTSYKYVDVNPYRGTSYYRLRQVDRDGTSQTFSAVGVVIDAKYSVYPNPIVQSSFTLELDEPADAQISLFTLTGSELSITRADSTDSSVRIKSTSPLSKGIYLLKVTERGTTRTYRLVTQ